MNPGMHTWWLEMTPDLGLWPTIKCCFYLLGPCDFSDIERDCHVQKGIPFTELFLKGFPVLPDNWCQQSKAMSHPEPWGLSGTWWQEPRPILF
jgi:hypothetical protein